MSKGKAIPFIIRNQSTLKYQLTIEAEQFLSTVTTNLSIVSVAGLYRTGKSYLLNRVILNQNGGFDVGSTVNACTKGLWIWNQVIHTVDNHHLLIIDTQGLGALDQQANHDMKIFCLAVLLSTTFIYNSVGSIDETALQNLNLVLNLVNTIDHNGQNRPNFIWVIRDFSLQLIDEYGCNISSKQYLQMALSNNKNQQKSTIRKTITQAFIDRDCFTLIKPIIDEQKLQKLQNIPIDQLRVQFVAQTMLLRKKIMSELKTIKLNSNEELKGKDYLLMVKKYTMAINQGVIPNITDTWTFIKQEKGRKISYELQKIYSEKIKLKMNNKLPIPKQQLNQLMINYKNQMIEQFHRLTYDDTSIDEIQNFLKLTHQQLQRINQQQNKIVIKSILNKQYQSIQKKIYSDYYNNYQQFNNQINNAFQKNLIEKYCSKYDDFVSIIEQFCDKKIIQNYKIFNRRIQQQLNVINQIQITKQENYQKQFKILKQKQQKDSQFMKKQIQDFQKKIIFLSNEKICLEQQLMKQKSQGQFTSQKNQKKIDQLLNNIQTTKIQLKQQNNKSEEIQKLNFVHKKQIQKQKALSLQKQQHLICKFTELQKKYQLLKTQFDQNGGKFDLQRKNIIISYDQKIRELLQLNKSKAQRIYELQNIVDHNQQEKYKIQSQIKDLKENYLHQTQQVKAKALRDLSNKKEDPQLDRLRRQNQDLANNLNSYKDKNEQLAMKYKQIQDTLKLCKNSNEKEIVIHEQQIQFQQIEINQLKYNYNELQKRYQNTLENMQIDSKENEKKLQQKIFNLMQQHQKNIKIQQLDFQNRINGIKKELQKFQKQNQSQQLQISLEKKKNQTKQKEFKQNYNSLENMYHNLLQKLASSEKDYQDLSQEKDNYFMVRVKKLEQEIQNVKEKANQQLVDSQHKSEQALNVLKNYSEMERQQWQRRLSDEKEKNNKQLKCLKDELDRKHQEQKISFEEEIIQLQQKMTQMERIFGQKFQNMQYDHNIKIQKMSNQYMEDKVDLQKKNALLTQEIELTRKSMEEQLNEAKKYYEHTIFENKKQMEMEFEQTRIKMVEERKSTIEKIQHLKKANTQFDKTIMVLKNENDKQKSIYKEKQKHYTQQILELQGRLSTELLSYKKTFESIHVSNEEERIRLNEQIDKLKKNLTQYQEQKNIMECNFESERNALIAKNSYLQSRVARGREEYEDTLKKFEISVKHLSERNKLGGFKQLEQMRQRIKLQFERRIHEKQQIFQRQCKDSDDKISRLQTQNKSLKDRLLLLQVRNSSIASRDTKVASEVEKVKDKYKDNMDEMSRTVEILQAQNRNLKQRQGINSMFNQSQRNSILTDTINQNGGRRMSNLADKKGIKKNGTPLISKKQKNGRVINLNDFTGIIKYQ